MIRYAAALFAALLLGTAASAETLTIHAGRLIAVPDERRRDALLTENAVKGRPINPRRLAARRPRRSRGTGGSAAGC